MGIVAKLDDNADLQMVRKILSLLKGEEILLEPKLARELGKRPGNLGSLGESDAVVTVGGDGTVLLAQRLAPKASILGINLGRRGFLADVQPKEAAEALRALRADKLQTNERQRLAAEADGKALPEALNDVVVCSGNPGKTATLIVSVDGREAMNVRCDGVIIATPTGSTAYARAAGGPVVDPKIEAIAIVPICPTHPRQSPMVVPPESLVEVASARPGREALVFVDGNPVAKIGDEKKVSVRRSCNYARFFSWADFYRKSRERL